MKSLCRLLCTSVGGQGRLGAGGGHCDVVVAGGGIMGCSSAFFLAQRVPPSSICIVERDPTVRMTALHLVKYCRCKPCRWINQFARSKMTLNAGCSGTAYSP